MPRPLTKSPPLQFRLSLAEFAALSAKARHAGVSPQDYAKRLCLEGLRPSMEERLTDNDQEWILYGRLVLTDNGRR